MAVFLHIGTFVPDVMAGGWDGGKMASNPRSRNGNLRRKYRNRFKAIGAPCGICHGKLGEIHYDEPSDSDHPLSFVIDEIIPISRAKAYGYESKAQAAQDWNNVQAAHWICNAKKGNKINFKIEEKAMAVYAKDGEW